MTTQNDLDLVWASTGGSSDPGDAKYATGWVSEKPTYQNFNYVLKNLSTNILAYAEQGTFTYESTIAYSVGAKVLFSDIVYTCISPTTGNEPSAASQYWTKGTGFGVDNTLLLKDLGVHLKDVNVRASATLWGSNDITIESAAPLINMTTNNAGTKNWLMGNVAGELVAVDIGTTTNPDDRSVALSEPLTHRLFHEGHPPVQSEIDDTIPANPVDGVLYARRDNAWEIVTSTTISVSPPPPVVGAGQGWYNLDDGQTYVDIDDGDSSQWVLANPPIIPEYLSGNNNNDVVDGLGTLKLLINNTGIPVSSGEFVAGADLNNVVFNSGLAVAVNVPTGTWKYVGPTGGSHAVNQGSAGYFTRTA